MTTQSNKPIITYIKNGQEISKIVTKWNQRKILKEVLSISTYTRYSKLLITYKIENEIELIHFQNFHFKEIVEIRIPKDSICIFENCIFEIQLDNHYYLDLLLKGGSFEFINPTLIGIREIHPLIGMREIDNKYQIIQDLSIITAEKNVENITIVVEGPRSCNCTNLSIEDNNNIESIDVSAQKTALKGDFKLDSCEIWGNEIKIGNQKTITRIDSTFFTPKIVARDTIQLTNCTINNPKESTGTIHLDAPKIEVKNVTLIADEYIEINRNRYQSKEEDQKVIVTDKELLRANLISVLKGYRRLLEQQIKQQGQIYLEPEYQKNQEQIAKQEQIINQKQQELNKLKQSLNETMKRKNQAITKSLSKKKVKNLPLAD